MLSVSYISAAISIFILQHLYFSCCSTSKCQNFLMANSYLKFLDFAETPSSVTEDGKLCSDVVINM